MGEQEMAYLFSLKYKELYNTVSYDEGVMTNLQNNIKDAIISKCASCTGCYTSYGHNVASHRMAIMWEFRLASPTAWFS